MSSNQKVQQTNIAVALKFLSSVMTKKEPLYLCFPILWTTTYEKTLKIAAKKHDVTGIRVYDKHDEEIPNLGMVPMLDSETGSLQLINTPQANKNQLYRQMPIRSSDYYIKYL